MNATAKPLPALARAVAFHTASLDDELKRRCVRGYTIERVYHPSTGRVDLTIRFLDDETGFDWKQRTFYVVKDWAEYVGLRYGFLPTGVQTKLVVTLSGYYGSAIPEETPAAPVSSETAAPAEERAA